MSLERVSARLARYLHGALGPWGGITHAYVLAEHIVFRDVVFGPEPRMER